jgi:hypothetical protein
MEKTALRRGTVWRHARRKDRTGEPVLLTITAVRQGKVYSRTEGGGKVKTPVEKFDQFCAEIVALPEPAGSRPTGPKLAKADAKALYARAVEAGEAAAAACTPTPMYVVERAHPLDDTSPIVKAYAPVMAGVCGFAWINIRPGNGSFARFLRAEGLGDRDSYYGGVSVRVFGYGQSYERKSAYASAFAAVLREAGVEAYPMSRLD